jgi:hypothetical protein
MQLLLAYQAVEKDSMVKRQLFRNPEEATSLEMPMLQKK